MPFVESSPSANMYHMVAREVMVTPVVCLTQVCKIRDIIQVLETTSHNGFPVVTGKSRKLVGLVLRNQLLVLLYLHIKGKTPALSDFSTSLQSKHRSVDLNRFDERDFDEKVDLKIYYNPVPISVHEQCPMSRVFVLFRSLGIRHL